MSLRIALLGNCQVGGLQACLQLQCPRMRFDAFHYADVRGEAEADVLAQRLAGYDLVLGQVRERPGMGGLSTDRLRGTARAWAPLPKIWFSGFHPDIVFAERRAEAPWRFGDSHSALVAGAYLAGIEPAGVERLFNSYVFARLGYFEEYGKARDFMARQLAGVGLDQAAVLDAWESLGVFMHTPSHPTIEALWRLARLIAERHGWAVAEGAERPADQLGRLRRWPVYPPLARRLGVQGALDFHFDPDRAPAAIAEFVDWSYARYRRHVEDVAALPATACAADLLAREVRGLRIAR